MNFSSYVCRCEGLVYTLDDKTAHLATLSKGHTEWIRAFSYNRKVFPIIH